MAGNPYLTGNTVQPTAQQDPDEAAPWYASNSPYSIAGGGQNRTTPGGMSTVFDVNAALQQARAEGAATGGDGYSWNAGNNDNGGAYDYFGAWDDAANNPNLSGNQRNEQYNRASIGVAQVRNPYDYVIGRDRDYVGNMAAQQQDIGAATQGQLSGLATGVGANTAANAAALQGYGVQSAGYGMDQAKALASGGNALASGAKTAAAGINSTAGYMQNLASQAAGEGAAAQGRNPYSLDFSQQGKTLGGALGFADQLGGMQQGPSAAQAALQAGANQSMAQSMALARSGRGFGGSALGQAQALQQNAATMQNVANQAAILRAQEDQAWRAQQAQNLAQAAGIYQGAAGQYGQQQALGAQTALQNAQQNDAFNANMYGLGLQGLQGAANAQATAGNLALAGGQAGLGVQQNAATLGLQGLNQGANLYGQGATLQNQGAQLQGALIGQGAQAASQGGLNAFGMNQQQNATDMTREAMISQDYATRKGIGIQQQQIDNGKTAAILGAVGTGTGALIGSLGGPGGTVAGAGLGGYAGNAAGNAASDARVKRNVRPIDASDPYRVLEGPPPLDERPKAAPRKLDQVNPYTDMRGAQGYSYEYRDPAKYGSGTHVGPMAQDLERSPATAGTVFTDPEGVKRIDTGRLALSNTSAISEQQRRLDELERRIREYNAEES